VTEKSVVASRKQKFTVAAFRGKCRWSKIICQKYVAMARKRKNTVAEFKDKKLSR
jgi:hypothetical protein